MLLRRTLPLLLAVLTFAGCGNLSNEDLVFLSAVPKPKEVELTVQEQSTPANALTSADAVGDDAAYYALASSIATGLNQGVTNILTLVDTLGKGYPPTERTDDARIWGPVANVDGKGLTLRLEIQRETLDSGAPRFYFCLAVAQDANVAGTPPRCREADKNGFQTILSGHYDPQSVEGGARSGSGEIKLDFEAAQRAHAAKPDERGTLALTYDFSQGGDAKQIHVLVTAPGDFGSLPVSMDYDYGRSIDAHVDFSFGLTNYIDPADASGKPSDSSITASWIENVAGRADAVKRGGDLEADQYAAVIECWDEYAKRTYAWAAIYKGTVQQMVFLNEGDPATCPQ